MESHIETSIEMSMVKMEFVGVRDHRRNTPPDARPDVRLKHNKSELNDQRRYPQRQSSHYEGKSPLVPKLQGFILPEATVDVPGLYKKRSAANKTQIFHSLRRSRRNDYSVSFFNSDCSSAEEDSEMLADIDIRGPASIGYSRSKHLDGRKQLSPPVVSPSRRLELTTRLGLAVVQQSLAQATIVEREEGRAPEKPRHLRTARIRPIGYIPADRKPDKSTCIGIRAVSSLEQNPFQQSPPVSSRPSTVPTGYELSMHLFENSLARSYSAQGRRPTQSLSVCRANGSVLTAVTETPSLPKQSDAMAEVVSLSPRPPLDSLLGRRPESAPAGPQAMLKPRKISRPIPLLRPEEHLDHSLSFHVRSLTSTDRQLLSGHRLATKRPTADAGCVKLTVSGSSPSHGRTKVSVLEHMSPTDSRCLSIDPTPLPLGQATRRQMPSLRLEGRSKSTAATHGPHGEATSPLRRGDRAASTPPVSKLSPLHGRVSPGGKLGPLVGSHIEVGPKNPSGTEPPAPPGPSLPRPSEEEWVPPDRMPPPQLDDLHVPT